MSGEDLQQRLDSLAKAVDGLHAPTRPLRLGGFVSGFFLALTVLLVVWWRYNVSLGRLTQRRRQQAAMREIGKLDPSQLRGLLGGMLPAWTTFPDVERVKWLNSIVQQLWPYVMRAVTGWAEQNVDELLKANKPSWIRAINMHHISLGDAYPEVAGVKVYDMAESENDQIIIELDFVWAGDQSISFVAKPIPKTKAPVAQLFFVQNLLDFVGNLIIVKAAVEHLTLRGRVRVILRPLLNTPPLIGSVQVAFTEVPNFSFDLTVYGGDVSLLPGLESWLHGLIKDSVLRPHVLPEKYVIPLINEETIGQELPSGILSITAVEAEHVPRMDLFSKSDPYVEFSVRDKQKVRTQVIENNSHPNWDERLALLVHYPDTQELRCRLFDYDSFGRHDEIGRVEMKVRELPPNEVVDSWFEVQPPHQEKPASDKYKQTGNPISLTARAGQKVVGKLVQPWNLPLFKPGHSNKLTRCCRLHLKLEYTPFSKEDVAAALEARRLPGGTEGPGPSESVSRIFKGGVLYVRVLKVTNLEPRLWLAGGYSPKVKAKVRFAGEKKSTPGVKGKKGEFNVDSELEFLIDGAAVDKADYIYVDVWDVRWHNSRKGMVRLPFQRVRDRKVVRDTFDLEDARKGRVSLECQWISAFAAT